MIFSVKHDRLSNYFFFVVHLNKLTQFSLLNTEAVPQRFSVKEVFFEFRKIYWKTPVPKSLF